jgi:hypothetical protein
MSQQARAKMGFRANIRGNTAQANVLSNATNATGHSAIQQALKMNFQNSKNANIQNTNKNTNGQNLNDINIKINTAKAATRKFDDNKKTSIGGSILGAL